MQSEKFPGLDIWQNNRMNYTGYSDTHTNLRNLMNSTQKLLVNVAISMACYYVPRIIDGQITKHKEKKRLIEENIFVLPEKAFINVK